ETKVLAPGHIHKDHMAKFFGQAQKPSRWNMVGPQRINAHALHRADIISYLLLGWKRLALGVRRERPVRDALNPQLPSCSTEALSTRLYARNRDCRSRFTGWAGGHQGTSSV